MAEDIITISNLSFAYPNGAQALKGIDLNIKRGEYLVVMGENGAGKTTLCLCLNGIIPNVIEGDYDGEVYVDGMKTVEHRVYELAQKVGIALQDPETQIFSPTVKTEVAFGPENLGVPREEILKRIDYALSVTRLTGMEERSPYQLSGGQKQRLALAAAIAMQPKVLVLDEPTSQLDPIGTTEVFSVVKNLNKEHNITIVMSEHKSDEIATFADRIAVLYKGELLKVDEPHVIFGDEALIKKARLKPPQVTELMYELRKKIKIDKIPITVDEACGLLEDLIKRNVIKVKHREQSELSSEIDTNRDVVIETKNLWHIYEGNVEALRDINLKIYDNDFVAIIGQNGAGKTTLVKHFNGLLRPTKGKVYIFGEDSSKYTTAEISKKVGMALQNPDHQLFATSLREEIAFGLRNLNVPEDEIDERIDEALSLVGLLDYKDEYPFKLPFGDRRKLTVAIVVAMRPKIIIFDEPTTGQDHVGRYEIMEIAKKLHEQGHTIIIVTHDMKLVAKYAKRTIVMGVGEILIDGPTKYVFSHPEVLESTFLKPPPLTQVSQRLSKYGFSPGNLTVDDVMSQLEFGG
ncbi:MAG: ABC transporter ATP-binding protein [Candidatus Asgardarchaeia archaeon]